MKKRWKEDRRGGPENATYEPCPGSFCYPRETVPSWEVWNALGPEIQEKIVLSGSCAICGKWMKVTRHGWISRHKELHESAWERDELHG